MELNYWFVFVGEDDELCGDEIFVVASSEAEAYARVAEIFPNHEVVLVDAVDDDTAEEIGLDTY